MIWVLYAHFEASRRQQTAINGVFHQVCAEIKRRLPEAPVRIDEINSKKELLACVNDIRNQETEISEWHFVGLGMPYGPLLGTPDRPEELSAYEWTELQIPLTRQARAWFYMERSEAWLAPFIASTYLITTYGCHQLTKTEPSNMRAYPPGFWNESADYNPIAALYAAAFSDITVRRDEIRWIENRLAKRSPQKVLDIGCGNGALLNHLSDMIKQGVGVDISQEAIRIASQNNCHKTNLSFTIIEGPQLPFADHTMDSVVSLLSFRYLDWEPILEEMKRVLAPGGHILIVDMLAASPKVYEWPLLIIDKLKSIWYLRNRQGFTKALNALVTHPAWRKMIERHPMHETDEFIWYLRSRFPDGEIEVLNRGAKAKIVAFDSGPLK